MFIFKVKCWKHIFGSFRNIYGVDFIEYLINRIKEASVFLVHSCIAIAIQNMYVCIIIFSDTVFILVGYQVNL